MAINKLRYYVGPLGYLQPLPPMVGGAVFPEAPIVIPGGQHVSLSGRITQDRVGTPKRSWTLSWENLTEADRLLIDALIHRSGNAALRLIDPRGSNRFPADASTGGSLSLSTKAFSSAVTVSDTCGVASSSSWSPADTGQAWTNTGGSASDYSKSGGFANHAVGSVNVSRWSTLTAPLADFDFTFTVATDKLATGASQTAHAVARFVDTNNALAVRADFTITQTVVLRILKRVAGSETTLVSLTVAGLTHGVGTRFAIRFKGTGSTLQAKIWLASGSQPAAWTLSTIDATFLAAGPVGVRSSLLTGNTNTLPVTFSFDDFVLIGATPLAFLNASLPTSLVGILTGAQSWSGLFLNSTLSAVTEKVPILAGSTYRFSVWAKGSAQFKLLARPFNLAGVEQAAVVGSTETATGSYQRFSWLWTPSAGHASAYLGLQAQGTGSIETTAWKVVIDESALTDWSFGVGCPTVVVDSEIPLSYWRAKYHRIKLQLREA